MNNPLFLFATITPPNIGENRKEIFIMEKSNKGILEAALKAQLEEMDELELGSEEYERAASGIAAMTKANAEDKKANNDAKLKTFEKIAAVVTAFAAVLTACFKGVEVFFKRKTNKEVLHVEETDYVNSKAYDNR